MSFIFSYFTYLHSNTHLISKQKLSTNAEFPNRAFNTIHPPTHTHTLTQSAEKPAQDWLARSSPHITRHNENSHIRLWLPPCQKVYRKVPTKVIHISPPWNPSRSLLLTIPIQHFINTTPTDINAGCYWGKKEIFLKELPSHFCLLPLVQIPTLAGKGAYIQQPIF